MKEQALEIINTIYNFGYVGYIVGGYVRDSLLNIESKDIDITTNATPMELKNIFKDEDMIISNYGSISLMYKGNPFEITTFRKEEDYFDNRHPSSITYVNDLETDLLRRDFTINALCIDKDGNLIDLINGKEDIKKHLIKTIIDSDKSFQDDALRILRAIRFSALLDFNLDGSVIKAIENNKHLLKNISYESKKKELDKIFASNKAKEGIDLIKKYHLEEDLELTHLDRIKDFSDIVGIWSMINTSAYNFTNSEKDLIEKINMVYDMEIDNRTIYKYGVYVCVLAGINKGIDKKIILKKYDDLKIKTKDEIDISAKEICKIYKRKAGAFLKNVYEDLEDKILNEKLENNNLKIKEYLKEKSYE